MSVPDPPSSELPTRSKGGRFHRLTTPTEWIEYYRPGHFHPVHIGDELHQGRYKIIRKLGYGSFSTVWMARDRERDGWVALKIVKAKDSSDSNELSFHQILAHHDDPRHDDENGRHVVALLDEFTHHGPNGAHLCLVLELMGPSASAFQDHLTHGRGKRHREGVIEKYPIWMAWEILTQALHGLDYLHRKGIVHGDLNPGNILLPVTLLDGGQGAQREELVQDVSKSARVRRLDGKEDQWAPRYLPVQEPLFDHVDIKHGQVKISDFGCAFWNSSPPAKPTTARYLRSPEVVLGLPFDQSIDIWSFGILVFEFFTGHPMFYPLGFWNNSAECVDDDHLLQMSALLGEFPAELSTAWTRSKLYYDQHGKLFNNHVKDDPSEEDKVNTWNPPLAEFFEELRCQAEPEEEFQLDDTDVADIMSVLRWTLQYDHTKRPSASELLEHPLFAGRPRGARCGDA
ncbi:MAG: hypothetical protein M1837_002374 [Sclerophora amabilis]|nr:MAG: hypothetical protein M1837_002374 [Sclerophora amabilis]